MSDEQVSIESETHTVGDELRIFTAGDTGRFGRVVMAAMAGIPWIGSLIGAMAALQGEAEQGRANEIFRRWIDEHQQKLRELKQALLEISQRLEQLGPTVDERIRSPEYLSLWSWLHTGPRKVGIRWASAATGRYL